MKEVLVIDGTGLILGRLCSYVAKKALLGCTVDVVNVERCIITGSREVIFQRFKRFAEMGGPVYGPFIDKHAQGLFKRSLRRMLPYKKARGIEALQKVKVYKGLPLRFKGQALDTLLGAHVSKLPNTKYVSLAEVASFLGKK